MVEEDVIEIYVDKRTKDLIVNIPADGTAFILEWKTDSGNFVKASEIN